jgi:hypothetical protein
MRGEYKNLVRIKVVADALKGILEKTVFVGGSIIDLYTDDPSQGEIRPTDDIDVAIEIINSASYPEIENKLRAIGFKNDIYSGVICRFRYHDIVVDIIPDDENILGFTNTWYKLGIQKSIDFELEIGFKIKIFPIDIFLASKLEALFSNRHGEDYRQNSDFEDIIFLFDNRINIKRDIENAENVVLMFLKSSLEALLKRRFINEEISTHLEFENRVSRLNKLLSLWNEIIN